MGSPKVAQRNLQPKRAAIKRIVNFLDNFLGLESAMELWIVNCAPT